MSGPALKSMADLAISPDPSVNLKKWNDAVQPLECVSRVMALDEETRQVKHVISTGTMDRGNRIVDVGGWRLAKYRDNPVVLANHDYSLENIIGKSVDTKIDGSTLVATTEFAAEGLGNVAFRLVQAGLARAWSVGWIGLKAHGIGEIEGCPQCEAPEVQKRMKASKYFYGRHYTQAELLEYSLVVIPSNPDAVMGLQAAGLVAGDEAKQWLASFAPNREPERTETGPPEPAKPTVATNYSACATCCQHTKESPAASATDDDDDEQIDDAPPPNRIERSAAFYDALNRQTRFVQRRATALRTSQQIRRRES